MAVFVLSGNKRTLGGLLEQEKKVKQERKFPVKGRDFFLAVHNLLSSAHSRHTINISQVYC